MNRLMNGLRDVLVFTSERRKPGQYRAWVHYLNKVVSEKLLPLFCSMKDSIDDTTRRALMKQACDILSEVEPTLSSPSSGIPEGAGDTAVTSAKQGLLELWHHILESLERIPSSEVGQIMFSVIVSISKRPEFDLSHLHLDVHQHWTCAPHDIMLAFRYRKLLFGTLNYISRILNAAIAADSVPCSPTTTPSPSNPSSLPSISVPPSSSTTSSTSTTTTTTNKTQRKKIKKSKGGKLNEIEQQGGKKEETNEDDLEEEVLEVLDAPNPEIVGSSSSNENKEKEKEKQQPNPPQSPPAHLLKKRVIEEGLKIDSPNSDAIKSLALSENQTTNEQQQQQQQQQQIPPIESPPPPPLEVHEEHPVFVDEIAETSNEPAPSTTNNQQTSELPPPNSSFMVPPTNRKPKAIRNSPGLSFAFMGFAAKTLALLYFRLPCIQEEIRKASIAEDKSNPSSFTPERIFKSLTAPNNSTTAQPNPDIYPSLFRWNQYHEAVKQWNKDDEEEKYSRSSKEWLVHFTRRGDLFVEFFNEWLSFTNSYVMGRSFEWNGLPGYQEFTKAFFCLYSYAQQEQLPQRTLASCETLLLATDHPAVLNQLIRVGYSHTSAREINAIISMLLAMEAWFNEISKKRLILGEGFDAQHFCEGLDIILQSDHHLIIAKELAIIYNIAELFQGEVRLIIFGDLLLKKHFFHLFLHWDENVRNIFCQILAFKMLSSKRKTLISSAERKSRRKIDAKKEKQSGGGDDTKSATMTTTTTTSTAASVTPQSIDMLLFVKIEAYIRVVSEYIEKAKVEKASKPIIPLSVKTTTVPKKKKFVIEDAPPVPSFEISPEITPSTTPQPTNNTTTATTTTTTTTAWESPRPTPTNQSNSNELTVDSIPENLAVYAERAFDDYKKHMLRYNEWQTRSTAETPRLLTLQ